MANGWHVTGQRGTTELSNGKMVPAMEVSVETDGGTSKSFVFADAQYTPEKVDAIIDAWAERERAIASLGNG